MDNYEEQAEILMGLMPPKIAEARLNSLSEDMWETYKLTRMMAIMHMMQEHETGVEFSFKDIVDTTKSEERIVAMVMDDLVEEGIVNTKPRSSEPENEDSIEGKITWVIP